MYLFLEGERRIGKSTMIRNALLPYREEVAGMMVQRLTGDGEQAFGFRVCTVEGELPVLEEPASPDLRGVFLHEGVYNEEILVKAIAEAVALCEKDRCKLIILDEIGGLELSSVSFMHSLELILSCGKPCIGVIKSIENLRHSASRVRTSDQMLHQSESLRKRIEAGGQILTVQSENIADAAHRVEDFIRIARQKN